MAKTDNFRLKRPYRCGPTGELAFTWPNEGTRCMARLGAPEGAVIVYNVPDVLLAGAPFKILNMVIGLVEVLVVHLLSAKGRTNKSSGYKPVDATTFLVTTPAKKYSQIAAPVRTTRE